MRREQSRGSTGQYCPVSKAGAARGQSQHQRSPRGEGSNEGGAGLQGSSRTRFEFRVRLRTARAGCRGWGQAWHVGIALLQAGEPGEVQRTYRLREVPVNLGTTHQGSRAGARSDNAGGGRRQSASVRQLVRTMAPPLRAANHSVHPPPTAPAECRTQTSSPATLEGLGCHRGIIEVEIEAGIVGDDPG